MPASLSHLIIANRVRQKLSRVTEPDPVRNAKWQDFLTNVLERYRNYMDLGALGPDLPYFGSPRSLCNPHRPLGVDQWSYQLHSKNPNTFPLKLLEIAWKESDVDRDEWIEQDFHKWAFTCGFLTHVAADQIIHPLVNKIAGSYYESATARTRHQGCEVAQDLYNFYIEHGAEAIKAFPEQRLDRWWYLPSASLPPVARDPIRRWIGFFASIGHGLFTSPATLEFTYLIQKGFVEAHAVKPYGLTVGRWLTWLLAILRVCNHKSQYQTPWKVLFDPAGQIRIDSEPYRKYILLEDLQTSDVYRGKQYPSFVETAVALGCVYIRAAYRIYESDELDDDRRADFRAVVRNADLGAPLETDILATAEKELKNWGMGRNRGPDQATTGT